MKKPSLKRVLIETAILLGLSVSLFFSGHFVLSSIAFLALSANSLRYIIKEIKYKEMPEEVEEKESLFSRFKNKVKSFGKKKNKKKDKKNGLISRIKNRKNKKKKEDVKTDEDTIEDIVEEDEVKENNPTAKKENNSKTKIDNIKKQKEALNNLKQDIVDGVYGLKKDQIIQDRINGKEINNFYKQKVKVKK